MTQRDNILQELIELGSTSLNVNPQNIYVVPNGYFEEFADQMLDRIKSPLLNETKQNPYTIPVGYFDGLEERLMQAIRESADYQTAKEELETISPFLNGLKKETPYKIPQGYFENLAAENKPTTKVISITHRRWFKYAAAAVIVGIVTTLAFMLSNNKPININTNPEGWVAKNVKKVNPNQLDEFIKLADEENNGSNSLTGKNEKSEIKDLIKDVSDKEIQDFLTETSVLEDNSLLN